jgi:hypothetical protein
MQAEDNSPVQQLKDWLAKEREGLLAANVSQMVATYSGSGDEGMYEGICIADDRGRPVEYSMPEKVETLIEEAIDTLALSGYENNEGGGGEIRLFPRTGSITHQSYFNTIEYRDEDEY